MLPGLALVYLVFSHLVINSIACQILKALCIHSTSVLLPQLYRFQAELFLVILLGIKCIWRLVEQQTVNKLDFGPMNVRYIDLIINFILIGYTWIVLLKLEEIIFS